VRAKQGPVGHHDRGGLPAAQLVGDRQAVPALDLDRRRTGPQASRARRTARAVRSAVEVARVADTVLRMPPARCTERRRDGLELLGPVAAEDQVGVAVDEPRQDARAVHVQHRIARGCL